jgi:hypothetical protein
MTVASRQWEARGGPIMLGKLMPGAFVCIGLASLGGSIATVTNHGWRGAAGAGSLVVAAFLAAYFAWRLLTTTWLVSLADNSFTWVATTRRWSVAPGEISAVRADASDQIIAIVTTRRKIYVWAHLNDRQELFDAIECANPSVEFTQWIDAGGP